MNLEGRVLTDGLLALLALDRAVEPASMVTRLWFSGELLDIACTDS